MPQGGIEISADDLVVAFIRLTRGIRLRVVGKPRPQIVRHGQLGGFDVLSSVSHSTGRCNGFREYICRRPIAEGLAWPRIELALIQGSSGNRQDNVPPKALGSECGGKSDEYALCHLS